MVGDYFFFGFFTRAGNFLYWVDFAHFMQSTEPSKPPDAKQARDCALDLNGMVSGKEQGGQLAWFQYQGSDQIGRECLAGPRN
jgi:hypothetical protein